MNKDLEFEDIGKRTPYKVPDGFFDRITEMTLAEAKKREARLKSARRKYWLTAISMTGVAALIVFGMFTDLNSSVFNKNNNLDTLVSSASAVTGFSATNFDSVAGLNTNELHPLKKEESSEIDKVISTMTDEEISLLADISSSDVFFDQH